jgi:hypothetical protein
MKYLLSIALACALFTKAQAAPLTSDDRKRLDLITVGISEATEIKLLKGFLFEPNRLPKEMKSKGTVRIHGFRFYRSPLSLSTADSAELRRLLTNKNTYERLTGGKLCGGFHPDFSIAWQRGEQVFYILICFHCLEFKLFGAGHELHTDTNPKAFEKLDAILWKCLTQQLTAKDS